jgi:hypothetical protein
MVFESFCALHSLEFHSTPQFGADVVSGLVFASSRYDTTDPPLGRPPVSVDVSVRHGGAAAAGQNGGNLLANITTKKVVEQFPFLLINVEPLSSYSKS